MVNAVYDHIIAILVVGVIFVGTVIVLPTMNFVNVKAVDQQQLRNTALNVFNAILLDTGLGLDGTRLTTDWGSIDPFDESRIIRFGLASTQDQRLYVLDPEKVLRLIESNPLGSISNITVKKLLGLENYGFALRILPPFNVTNKDGTKIDQTHPPITLIGSKLRYAIRVSYLDGRPIPKAVVDTNIFYTTRDDFFILPSIRAFTDAQGFCMEEIGINPPSEIKSLIAVFRVTVADVATMIVTYKSGSTKIADINVVGDTVVLTRTKDTPSSNVWIMNATYMNSEGELIYLFNASKKNDKLYQLNTGSKRMWNGTYPGLSYDNPVCFVLNFWANDPERTEIVIAGPSENLMGYTVFQYGLNPKNSRFAVRLQRSVIISGMTYTAELILWEESS